MGTLLSSIGFLLSIFVACTALNAVAADAAQSAAKSELAARLDTFSSTNIPEATPDTLRYALLHGTPTLDARYRYEHVDQDHFTKDADASTLRTRLGYTTGLFNGFDARIEWQNIQEIGSGHYNSGANSQTQFPTVTDPQSNRLNELYLGYHDKNLTKSDIILGRQVISLDNQRFISVSDWRQSNQVFDAVSITNNYFDHAKLFYAYINQVNRSATNKSPVGTYESNSHLINGSYEFAPALKLTSYTYLLDFGHDAPTSSNATYGGRLTGSYPTSDVVTVGYAAEAAHQTDYGSNTANVSENYYLLEPSVSAYGFTVKPGYEVLQGNGVTAFQTPLSTSHTFGGWTDKFFPTLSNGIENSYVNVSYKVPFGDEYLKGTQLTTVYHNWDVNHGGGAKYGTEWDWMISQTFFDHYELGLEAANYSADAANAATQDTQKLFAWLRIRY
jgi:hypothetical protein